MNKKLLAAALSAAFVAPIAMADVVTYGVINSSVEFAKATGATNSALDVKSVNRVTANNSRIGFKGWEDLGNGLKAIWQVEQNVDIDTGNSTTSWANRNSFVGLEGSFGRVLLGKHDSAYKTMTIGLGTNILADTSADTCNSQAIFCRGDQRVSNTVQYYSPVVNGFSAGVSYGADETRATVGGNRANAYSLSFGGKYVNGGLAVGAGYEHRNDSVATSTGLDTDYFKLVGAYTFASATTLAAGYEHSEVDQFAKSAKKQDGFTLAVKQQLGAWGVGASYTWLGKEKNGAEGDGKAKQWVLAATYDLSKRTQVQAYATKLSNNKSANRNFGINPLNGTLSAAGADPQAIGVGIRHAF